MTNQFTNPTPEDTYKRVLEKSYWQQRMLQIEEALSASPKSCVVVPSHRPPFVMARMDGRRIHLSTRRMFQIWRKGRLSDDSYVSCGTKGCVNPAHSCSHPMGKLKPLLVSP